MLKLFSIVFLASLSTFSFAGIPVNATSTVDLWFDSQQEAVEYSTDKAKSEYRKDGDKKCGKNNYSDPGDGVAHLTQRKGPFSGQPQYKAIVRMIGSCNFNT